MNPAIHERRNDLPSSDLHIGFIGLGNMGWRMAANLVRAGFPVVGFDVEPAREEQFHAELGTPYPEIELLAQQNVVITMLPTSSIVEDVLVGARSRYAPFLSAETLVVDMSSSQPRDTRRLGERLASTGVRMVDAPVSGGITGAETGTLTVMLGSDTESDANIVEPILRAMGEQIFRTGNLGSGHALKALNNYVAASGFATAAEALVLAGKCGLEAKTFLDVLNSSSGRNFSTETTLRSAVLTESFDTGFSLGLMTKDVAMAVELANDLGQDAEIGKVLFQRLQAATQHLGSHVDHSEAIKYWSGEPSSLLGRESKC